MSYRKWEDLKIDIDKIHLDPENPRVFLEDPSDDNLKEFIVNNYDVIELAKKIQVNGGLPPAEKPVLVLEDNKYIVVEGNRRITAMKILLDPSFLSDKNRSKVPGISDDFKNYLSELPVVVAPSRDSVEPYISFRHSRGGGPKPWTTVAVIRRYVIRYDKKESINQIARSLQENPNNIRKGIRFYKFLEYIKTELNWTEEELKKLEIFNLKTSKLDRFLPFSDNAKSILKIKFNKDQSIMSELPKEKFDSALENIIRRIYLLNEIDTRSSQEDVFNSDILEICKVDKQQDQDQDQEQEEQDQEQDQDQEQEQEEQDQEEQDQEEQDQDQEQEQEEQDQEQEQEEQEQDQEEQEPEQEEDQDQEQEEDQDQDQEEQEQEQEEDQDQEQKKGGWQPPRSPASYTTLMGAYNVKHKYKGNKRINKLFRELSSIKYRENQIASMFLIRALLENYTHEYIDLFAKEENISRKVKGVPAQRVKRNQTVRELLFSNIKNHLNEHFLDHADVINLIEVNLTNNNNTATTAVINYYIHSQNEYPDKSELLDSWSKVSSIINALDDILYKES